MKNIISILLFLLSLHSLFAQINTEGELSFPPLEGPYMGQKPPGVIAEPFAPSIISKDTWELEGVFAPGMSEFYFTLDRGTYTSDNPTNFKPTVIGFRQENNVWKKFIEFPRDGEITFSPDGQRMHMAEGYKDRVGDGWSERKSLGPMFDREDWGIMRLSASSKGTFVFDDYKNNDAIRISEVKDGKRQEPVLMGEAINSGKMTAHPFIAPDESYVIWDSERPDGYGDSDLYISFRQEDGTWGPAINMGEGVNSPKWDAYATVTPDSKYILFNRGIDDKGDNIDIYWVNAKIIESLRLQEKSANTSLPPLEDRYFGEQPPGLIPKLFAPAILSPEGFFEGGSFSPDMQSFYFSRKNGKYKERKHFVIRYENNTWGNESETDIKSPRYSRDGTIIYKGNQYRERTESGWSELKSMGPPFTDKHIMGISVSDNGTFFFDEFERPDTVGAISYSRFIDGKYEPRQKMGPEINTGTWIAHPHIAPDESYLIWDVEREDGYGGSEIYISFRQQDGSWLPAMNMGAQINTELHESGARVSPDGKYLFFSRGEWKVRDDGSEYWVGKPYWVDAKIIETLRLQAKSANIRFPSLEDRYFGEQPPGLIPKLFAPAIVSPDGLFEGGSYSPDMKMFYFTRKNGKYKQRTFFVIRYENGSWGNESETDIRWPQFSADGNTMYLRKEYRERTDTGWSEPKSQGAFLKDQAHGMSISAKGTYYFAVYKQEDREINGAIHYSRLIDGKQENPVKMSAQINTGTYIAHPFIAPDESYLIWDVRQQEGGYGQADLYISFKQKDGSWLPAINMGPHINTEFQESSPRVTHDGKYLFFTRGEWKVKEDGSRIYVGKRYWVDAQVIETLRP